MEDENLHPDFRQTCSGASIQWRSNSQSDTEQDDPSDNQARPSKQRRTRKTPPPLDKETPRFAFYDKAKKPPGKAHICPFPACPTHRNTPRKRRDAIKFHLLDIRIAGYDEAHPQGDDLWTSWLVQGYYLQKRPPALEPAVKKARANTLSKRYYHRRMKEVDEHGDEMKERLERNEITADQYSKFLVGHRRAEFNKSRQIEARVKERLAQLNVAGSSASVPGAPEGEAGRLEAILSELNDSKERSNVLMQQAAGVLGDLLSLWDKGDRYEPLAIARSYAWPTRASKGSFYKIAAMVAHVDYYDNPWEESSIRELKRGLHEYVVEQKAQLEDEDLSVEERRTELSRLDNLVSVFNASSDLIVDEGKHIEDKDAATVQDWMDVQQEDWEDAQAGAVHNYAATYSGVSGFQVMQRVDVAGQMYNALQETLRVTSETAGKAHALLRGT